MLHGLNAQPSRGGYDPTVLKPSVRAVRGAELVSDFLDWHENHRGSAASTLVGYRSVLGALVSFAGERGVQELTRADLEGFVLRPRSKRGSGVGSPRSRRRDVSVLRGFYGWLQAEGVTVRNIAGNLAAPKIPAKEPRPIDRDVWLDVWHSEMPPLLRVALGLGHFVGLRRAEVAAVCGAHFDDYHRIKGFIRKGGGEHTVPWLEMVETVCARMPEHKSRWTDLFVDELRDVAAMVGPHPLLSPWSQSLHPGLVNRKYEKHHIPFTPHRTRDSCATNLVDHCGVPVHIVCDLLNHGSIQVTMGYVRVASNSLANWRATQ